MTKRTPRPTLRNGVGQGKAKTDRHQKPADLLELELFDPMFPLNAAGRDQWARFAADPLPWWTDADVPTISHFCLIVGRMSVRNIGVDSLTKLSREARMLEDQLGLSAMSRARLKIVHSNKPQGDGAAEVDEGQGDGADVIPIGELFSGGDGTG